MCGGTIIDRRAGVVNRGLSPRVRGNLFANTGKDILLGSIPACAGEPGQSDLLFRRRRVYPRVCGGTTARSTTAMSNSGLSPRVRGNHARG